MGLVADLFWGGLSDVLKMQQNYNFNLIVYVLGCVSSVSSKWLVVHDASFSTDHNINFGGNSGVCSAYAAYLTLHC